MRVPDERGGRYKTKEGPSNLQSLNPNAQVTPPLCVRIHCGTTELYYLEVNPWAGWYFGVMVNASVFLRLAFSTLSASA
jgi:hypothetical protein